MSLTNLVLVLSVSSAFGAHVEKQYLTTNFFTATCPDCTTQGYRCLALRKECDTFNPDGPVPHTEPAFELELSYEMVSGTCFTKPTAFIAPPTDATIAFVQGYQVKVEEFGDSLDLKPECMVLDLRDAAFKNRSYLDEPLFTLPCFQKLSSGLPLKVSVYQYPKPPQPYSGQEAHFTVPKLHPDPTGLFCERYNQTKTTEASATTEPPIVSTNAQDPPKSAREWLRGHLVLLVGAGISLLLTVTMAVVTAVVVKRRMVSNKGYRRESLNDDSGDKAEEEQRDKAEEEQIHNSDEHSSPCSHSLNFGAVCDCASCLESASTSPKAHASDSIEC